MAEIYIGVISPIASLIFGILILIFPKILRWAVGLYLLIWGILQFTGAM